MSEAYQFAIGRPRALILAGCFAAAAVLLFFAGAITGTLYTTSRQSSAVAVVNAPVVKVPDLPAVKAPEAGAGLSPPPAGRAASAAEAPASGSSPISPAPGAESTIASSVAPPAATPAATASVSPEGSAASSSAAASTPSTNPPAAPSAVATGNSPAPPQQAAKPASAPAPPPIAAPSYAIQLAVRVGSFSVKSNAETVTQSLRDMGYQPTLNRSTDIRGRVWYVVKLGPYTKWNTASVIATRISIAENVTPVIGPM